jgi:tRNA threonylcarbamoyl adenosine modification protein YeaZ
MDVLALETSTARGSVALWRDGKLVDVREFFSDRAHNAVLFSPLEALLRQADGLGLIVVGTGPGSYTGVRVGIAAGIGISVARGVPLIGLPSITGLAAADGIARCAVSGDARRGAWWWAEVENGRLAATPVAASLEETAARAAAWNGPVFTADPVSPPFCQATVTFPKAEMIAAAAGGLSERAVARLAELPPEPIYLTAPFVTVSKQPVFA